MAFDFGKAARVLSHACPPATYLIIPPTRLMDRLQGGPLHKAHAASIQRYCTQQQRQDAAYMRRIRRDLWYSFIRYDCPFDEYFMFRFPQLSHQGRRAFVTDYEATRMFRRAVPDDVRDLFWNKWHTYQIFKDFYHRDAMLIDGDTTVEELAAFVQKHPKFIIKPCEDSFGRGVSVCDTATDGRTLEQILADLRDKNVMLEELIVQCGAMAKLHPASVNTVRCATFLKKDGQVDILFTFLRVGQKGSVVDNAGAGGFVASVDARTGIVQTPGITEGLHAQLIHPDTGEQIIGLRIPQWEDMIAFAKKLAQVYPQQFYGSWDLALTDRGWVMVEGNHAGQFVCPQFTTGRGIRPLASQYFDL